MKILTISFLLLSGFVFGQFEPLEKFKEKRSDSAQAKKHDIVIPESLRGLLSDGNTEELTNRILNKKTENPEQYTMLIKKPDTDKIISIPNTFPIERPKTVEKDLRERILER